MSSTSDQLYTPLSLPVAVPCEHPLLRPAFEAAILAGKNIVQGYGRAKQVSEKEPGQLVSEIDLQVDELIVNYLSNTEPKYPVISEESYTPSSKLEQDCWLVDPIDGTAAFVFETQPDIPAVMIALREKGNVALAVVLFPLTGEWCFGVRGQGAFNERGERLTFRASAKNLQQSLVALNPQHELAQESAEFSAIVRGLRSSNGCRNVIGILPHSTLSLRMLRGESPVSVLIHDNSPETEKQGFWDTAPVSLLVDEGGGVFFNLDGQSYVPQAFSPIVVAVSRELAEEVLAFVVMHTE